MSHDTQDSTAPPGLQTVVVQDEFRITILASPEGVIEDVIETSLITGVDPAAVVGRTLMEVSARGAQDPARASAWEHRLGSLASATGPVRWMDRQPGSEDGSVETVAYTATPIRDPATSELRHFLLQVRDGTLQHRIESQLRASAEHLRAALSITGLGSFAYDPVAGAMIADERLSEILGRDAGDLIRQHGAEGFYEIVHVDDRDAVRDALVSALRGDEDYDVEYRLQPAPGSLSGERWLRSVGRVEFDDGRPTRMLGVVEDITDHRARAEAQLRSQKREAIGTLAGGVAHDFNNVISAILSNAAVARTELAAGVSPATSISEIAQGAERAADIVRRLLAFSREEPDVRIPFDLSMVAREACALSRATLPVGVRLECNAADDVPPVYGSSTELHQVVINLVNNAGGYADPRRGEVVVDVRAQQADDDDGGPGHVVLRVSDNGPGVSPTIRHRMFDPFFTTKDVGEGTGLGLAAAQTIVRGHGGEITVGDAPGGGALITVVLPASTLPLPASQAPVEAAPAPSGDRRLRVLFVDDEPALVMLAERALPHRGFLVLASTGPEAALEAFEADPGGFDAVVTDLSMPGMTGLELIGRIRETRPGLPAVLSSGFITHETRAEAEGLGVDAIVPKPCSVDDLADALMRVCHMTAT